MAKYRISHYENGFVVEEKVFLFGWIWSGPYFRHVFKTFDAADQWVRWQMKQHTVVKEYDTKDAK